MRMIPQTGDSLLLAISQLPAAANTSEKESPISPKALNGDCHPRSHGAFELRLD